MTEQEFIYEVKKLNVEITNESLKKLNKYYELLIEYNNRINLTTIIDKKEVYLKHFYDSLTLVKVYNFKEDISLCDVGSGAGFPSIVLKIFFPNLKITIIDCLEKRINFLNVVIKELNLINIEAIHRRAEEYAKENREKFDIVTARAVARLNILLELCIPLLKEHGYFLVMKGSINEELKEAKKAIDILNLKIEAIEHFRLPKENSDRCIIKIIKNKITNIKYPRIFSKIKKKPL
jgi:16S rRNA (guanine527-N7)-methyltransferase